MQKTEAKGRIYTPRNNIVKSAQKVGSACRSARSYIEERPLLRLERPLLDLARPLLLQQFEAVCRKTGRSARSYYGARPLLAGNKERKIVALGVGAPSPKGLHALSSCALLPI